ncbi:hypothetical protein WJX81_000506 [Elliptochloris bilobata]|uniref:Spermatogenesis-associated protein 20-like TRX domain-containing protein n=1 Tax=Elliptochloris bilobata TaxID=381761 RepID=A0AAW1QMM8_9CHLO
MGTASKPINRLANEESPYLLQHQHNPVDWYAWGEDAFAKAKKEDKPVFLSVGYSTCHWCHVMERESFENNEIAKLLNQHFVSIKVDREERPDVDRVYMTFVQATTGSGGWPMSAFLTPDLQPFYGGTYLPPCDAFGRPGFPTVLRKIAEMWASKRDAIKASGADIVAQLTQAVSAPAEESKELGAGAAARHIDACASMLATRYDARHGGFGGAPKFPRVSELNLLLVKALRDRSQSGGKPGAAECMAVDTLLRMAGGGIYDHVGGGFHRYSVDELWHVPHFEKMLYDQPQLVRAHLDAFALTGGRRHAAAARGVLDYLLRDLAAPGGGFYSAEDADSVNPEGKKTEGAFYLWRADEVAEALGGGLRAVLFAARYGVRAEGNCTMSPSSDPHGEFVGLNCLIERGSVADAAAAAGVPGALAEGMLADARETLHKRRAQRPRPHLDDKVVAAWNGMAIGAFASAARVLAAEDPPLGRAFPIEGTPAHTYLQTAVDAANVVQQRLWDPAAHRLKRSFCRNTSAVDAFAEDYAAMVAGLLDLYGAGGGTRWLAWAQELQAAMDAHFWDAERGGYYATAGHDASILLRMKEDQDNAEPAASSIAVANLARLAALAAPGSAGADALATRAAATAGAFAGRLEDMAQALPQLCASLHLLDAGHLRQVIIAGRTGAPDTEALLDAAHAPFAPDKAIILVDPASTEDMAFWREHNPAVLEMVEGAGLTAGTCPATAFVCQNFTCLAPTCEPKRLRTALAAPRQAPAAKGAAKPVDVEQLLGSKQ